MIPAWKTAEAKSLVTYWLPRYPSDPETYPWIDPEANRARRASEARWLQSFQGLRQLTEEQIHQLVNWKWGGRRPNWKQALDGFDNDRGHASGRIEGALKSLDLDKAVDALRGETGGLPGWQCAMASVVLAACRPEEFTVADSRSLRTVLMLRGRAKSVTYFHRTYWAEYQADCSELAKRLNVPLRELDQAFWASRGRPAS
jgi:hypothetical protein